MPSTPAPRSSPKRSQLAVATACDGRAQVAVTVVELRGSAPRFWEHVERGPSASSAAKPHNQMARVYEVARGEGLRDFDVRLAQRVRSLGERVPDDLGDVRLRTMTRNNKGNAKQRARVKLRQLVPLPEKDDAGGSWAELGIELEIAAYTAAAAGDPLAGDPWDPLILTRDLIEGSGADRQRRAAGRRRRRA